MYIFNIDVLDNVKKKEKNEKNNKKKLSSNKFWHILIFLFLQAIY
jgi:hypothetical protein